MKNRMSMQIANISNNSKRRNFEIEDMSKPSDKVRDEGLKRARDMIHGSVGKKTTSSFVSLTNYTSSINLLLLGKYFKNQS